LSGYFSHVVAVGGGVHDWRGRDDHVAVGGLFGQGGIADKVIE
jgi:hypothetical protein